MPFFIYILLDVYVGGFEIMIPLSWRGHGFHGSHEYGQALPAVDDQVQERPVQMHGLYVLHGALGPHLHGCRLPCSAYTPCPPEALSGNPPDRPTAPAPTGRRPLPSAAGSLPGRRPQSWPELFSIISLLRRHSGDSPRFTWPVAPDYIDEKEGKGSPKIIVPLSLSCNSSSHV